MYKPAREDMPDSNQKKNTRKKKKKGRGKKGEKRQKKGIKKRQKRDQKTRKRRKKGEKKGGLKEKTYLATLSSIIWMKFLLELASVQLFTEFKRVL